MKTMEFESGLEPKKKLMVVLFWTNRKAARTEGCAPFRIMKITTPEKTYTPEGKKLLKLSDEILDELEKEIEADNPLYMELSIGNEVIEATLEGDTFTVSTQVSEEIEDGEQAETELETEPEAEVEAPDSEPDEEEDEESLEEIFSMQFDEYDFVPEVEDLDEEDDEDEDRKGTRKKKKKRKKYVQMEYDPDQDVMVVKKKRKRADEESWDSDW